MSATSNSYKVCPRCSTQSPSGAIRCPQCLGLIKRSLPQRESIAKAAAIGLGAVLVPTLHVLPPLFEREMNDSPVPQATAPKPAFETSNPPVLPGDAIAGCPSITDAYQSVTECQNLIAEEQGIIGRLDNTDRSAKPSELREDITRWQAALDDWKSQNTSLIAACYLLVGADGTAVHPEISLALDNLARAESWLASSIDSAHLGKYEIAHAYNRAAWEAADRAYQLLEGKVKPSPATALIKMPADVWQAERS